MQLSRKPVFGVLVGAVVATVSLVAPSSSVAADSVTVNGQTRALSGTNVFRGTDFLVKYTPAYGSSTRTNRYGFEAKVVDGIVKKVTDGVGNMAIPANGFVLSGHGTSRSWLRTYAKVGVTVSDGSSTDPTPTPTPTTTPNPSLTPSPSPTNQAAAVRAGADGTASLPTPSSGGQTDTHGVTMLKPSISGGMAWTSDWTMSRTFGFGFDPKDPWMEGRGSGTYKAGGGELKISGSTPRLYVQDPSNTKQWRDLEITTYFKKVNDFGSAYDGMTAVARTSHLPDSNSCDTRGLASRFRNDGHIDFEKETAHPSSKTVVNKTQWSGGLPKNVWIGYKYLVFDLPNGNVRVEAWIDTTDGANGGTWKLLNSFEDNGTNWAAGGTACKSGINPAMKLTNAPSRAGSETGKPNASVYFRSTSVGTDGLVLKKASVREIDADGSFSTETTSSTGGATVNLDGSVSDDGYPNPPAATSVTWTKVSGPGTVTFGNAGAVDTTATFTVAGTYVIRLTATDGQATTTDDVTVVVR
ncbi:MAG: PKD domain-containing protein [Nocardioides sp.]